MMLKKLLLGCLVLFVAAGLCFADEVDTWYTHATGEIVDPDEENLMNKHITGNYPPRETAGTRSTREVFNIGSTSYPWHNIYLSNGVVGDPSYGFGNDAGSNTGFYLIGQNNIGITTAGGLIANISDTVFKIGSANYDRLEIADDGTSEATLYKVGDNALDIGFNAYYDGSWHSYDSSRHSWYMRLIGNTGAGSSVDWVSAQPGAPNAASTRMRLTEFGTLEVNTGTAATPAYSFLTDTDTGMYRVSANHLGLAAGGTKILDISEAVTSISSSAAIAGNVGIGVAAGGKRLNVRAVTSTGDIAGFGSSDIADVFVFERYDDAAFGTAKIKSAANHPLEFAPGGTTVLEISTTGVETTGTYTYASAQTRYYGLPAAAYVIAVVSAETHLYTKTVGSIRANGTAATYFHAPVFLPHGAIVTKLSYYYDFNDSNAASFLKLWRINYANSGGDTMAQVDAVYTDGSPSSGSDSTISNATIDNNTYSYAVELLFDNFDASDDFYFRNSKIDFTITSPLP